MSAIKNAFKRLLNIVLSVLGKIIFLKYFFFFKSVIPEIGKNFIFGLI
jgi:hypothetical protein